MLTFMQLFSKLMVPTVIFKKHKYNQNPVLTMNALFFLTSIVYEHHRVSNDCFGFTFVFKTHFVNNERFLKMFFKLFVLSIIF